MNQSRATVVTRFAPSPTGFLHIGGARTALFNWLFARRHGGTYLLRVEDTDLARSTPEAVAAIFDGLEWLGLAGDQPAVFQTANAERHRKAAERLLAMGLAYRCFHSPDELHAMRREAERTRKPFRIRSRWRDTPVSELPSDQPFAVRLKAPQSGETTITDLVQGEITVRNSELDDLVLLRSDGMPTYMLAVVVDDHDMGVTHVIRGDDHINNAFRQLAIIKAMMKVEAGWQVPAYGHIPLIHGADGAKLSKRHGALGVDTYRDDLGILPEALFNALLRLGWGHGNAEVISRDEAIEWFDIGKVGKSAARFDLAKLTNLNAHYLKTSDDARLAEIIFERRGRDIPLSKLVEAIPTAKHGVRDLNELARAVDFLALSRPIELDEKASLEIRKAGPEILSLIFEELGKVDRWTSRELEAAINALAQRTGHSLGKLAMPLRAALTGTTVSLGIFDVLALLGKGNALGRISDRFS